MLQKGLSSWQLFQNGYNGLLWLPLVQVLGLNQLVNLKSEVYMLDKIKEKLCSIKEQCPDLLLYTSAALIILVILIIIIN
jgi:hypothetical protein